VVERRGPDADANVVALAQRRLGQVVANPQLLGTAMP
jgi:hypothetical protein